MKTLIFATFLSVLGLTVLGQQHNNQHSPIVLVHGAWSDASAWKAVVPLLEKQGLEVITVNLPGHGDDATSFAGLTLQSYADAVKAAIGDRKNVILVGHSMGGQVISQVGEEIPGQIKTLVYLAAFLPSNGESLLALSQQDAGSHIGKYLQVDKEHGAAIIAKEGVVDIFCADAPKAASDELLANWKPEPLAPLAIPVSLTDANFGKLKKAYIYTVNDHAISYAFQQQMVKKSNVKTTAVLQSSHTPFISEPAKLAADILKVSK